jgi:hypothetical protein
MRSNVRLDTSYEGPPHPFKDVGEVADSLPDIHNAMKCLFAVRSCTRKGFLVVPTGRTPEDSSPAIVEAMQCVLCLYIGHDTCY